jgi:hypothetical protein
MKSIIVKITAKFEEYDDVADEIMLDDVMQGMKYDDDFDFELVKDDDNPFDMSNPIYEAGYNQGHFDAKYSEEIAREMDEQKEV